MDFRAEIYSRVKENHVLRPRITASPGRGGFLGAIALREPIPGVCPTLPVTRSVNIHVSTRILPTVKETSP